MVSDTSYKETDRETEAVSRRRRRGGLVFAGVLLSALFGFVIWPHHPSRDAWEQYKRQAAARGESLDWREYAPAPPPPERENFAATPLLRRIGRKGQSDTKFDMRVNSPTVVRATSDTGDWRSGRRPDLAAIQIQLPKDSSQALRSTPQTTPAVAVLAALSVVEPDLRELREASQRRFAKFELKYADPFSADIPNFVSIRTLAHICSLHASAALVAGRVAYVSRAGHHGAGRSPA